MPTGLYKRPYSIIEEIERIAKSNTDKCIPWPYYTQGRSKDPNQRRGYVKINGKNSSVGRIILEMSGRPPPSSSHMALHATRNICIGAICCNPRHLRWGTAKENTQDAIYDDTLRKGETSPASKLTEVEVQEILLSKKSASSLAEEYSMSTSAIKFILYNRNWKHIHREKRERRVKSSFTEEDAKYLKEQKALGRTYQSIADEFNCDRNTVSYAIRGTQAEKDQSKTKKDLKGSNHPLSKLREENVLFILDSKLSNEELGKMFSISKHTVKGIRSGNKWKYTYEKWKNGNLIPNCVPRDDKKKKS